MEVKHSQEARRSTHPLPSEQMKVEDVRFFVGSHGQSGATGLERTPKCSATSSGGVERLFEGNPLSRILQVPNIYCILQICLVFSRISSSRSRITLEPF